jgi:hypothetical protein
VTVVLLTAGNQCRIYVHCTVGRVRTLYGRWVRPGFVVPVSPDFFIIHYCINEVILILNVTDVIAL